MIMMPTKRKKLIGNTNSNMPELAVGKLSPSINERNIGTNSNTTRYGDKPLPPTAEKRGKQ